MKKGVADVSAVCTMTNQRPNPPRKNIKLADLVLFAVAIFLIFMTPWGNTNSYHRLMLFLYVVCVLLRFSNIRKQKMREYYQRGEELTEENGGWDGYVWGDTREEYIEVRRAFLTMDEEDRMIVGMHVFGGYKTREIAQILAMNENTVRSREHRALQRMEKQLKGLR